MEIIDKAEKYNISEDITIFDDSVLKGVSSNFCHAVAEISSDGKSDVVINIEFNNGIDKDTEVKEISIKKEIIPIIDKVAEYFKKDIVEENFTVIGYVTKLHQEIDEVEGEITLSALVEEKLRKVKMMLNEEQYTIAVTAHQNKNLLVCKGILSMQERSTTLLNVISVLIGDEGEL
jgi:hypothetical protein